MPGAQSFWMGVFSIFYAVGLQLWEAAVAVSKVVWASVRAGEAQVVVDGENQVWLSCQSGFHATRVWGRWGVLGNQVSCLKLSAEINASFLL